MRASDGWWMPNNDWQSSQQRQCPEHKYMQRCLEGFVDLLKSGQTDCPNEKEIIVNLYRKFKDKKGITNIHRAYQAAWFIDWWCAYVGRDMAGHNYNKRTKERITHDPKSKYPTYVPYNGFPPVPFRQEFCDYAWTALHISKTYWFSVGTNVTVEPHETIMKFDHQEVVDDLWKIFLNISIDYYERGYIFDHIPVRLRAFWNQSCLKSTSFAISSNRTIPFGIAAASSSMDVASPIRIACIFAPSSCSHVCTPRL